MSHQYAWPFMFCLLCKSTLGNFDYFVFPLADVLRVLEDGDLQTLGLLDYDKRLSHSFTAHPKVDPFTGKPLAPLKKTTFVEGAGFYFVIVGAGEMFTFGYSHTPPYITYRVISKDGYMHDPVPITISDPIMMHDFAITENYAIFMDLPLYFRPKVCD